MPWSLNMMALQQFVYGNANERHADVRIMDHAIGHFKETFAVQYTIRGTTKNSNEECEYLHFFHITETTINVTSQITPYMQHKKLCIRVNIK